GGGRAWVVDWSWPTLGAAWVDPACLALWLIVKGHHPAVAEHWLAAVPAGRAVPAAGLDAFVCVAGRLWSGIAADDPQEWKAPLPSAADRWSAHRSAQ